jgi:hypothetical protein
VGGRIDIFATDGRGTVFHHVFEAGTAYGRGDWCEVGGGVRGALAALASPRGGLGLFATAPDGEVLYKRRPPGEDGWLPAGSEWERLGVAATGPLSAEAWPDGTGLLLAVVAEADETVWVLPWPDYPEGAPRGGWQSIGTVTSLLQGRLPGEDREEAGDGG